MRFLGGKFQIIVTKSSDVQVEKENIENKTNWVEDISMSL
jgi:hypothetical protein